MSQEANMHKSTLCCGLLMFLMGALTVSCSNSSSGGKDLTTHSQQTGTEAPSAPTNRLATAGTSSQINHSWFASSDNKGIAGYQIQKGETTISAATGTSYSDTGLVSNKTYTDTIRAFDHAGNASSPGPSARATTVSMKTEPSAPHFDAWRLVSFSPRQIMDYTASVAVNGDIYVYKGGGWPDYWRYSLTDNSWQSLAPIPDGRYPYFNLTWLGGDQLYTFPYSVDAGSGLWQYSISRNVWSQLASYPGGTVFGGANAVGAIVNNENRIYVLAGPDDFWKYSTADNAWNKMKTAPPFSSVMIATEDNYIYGIHIGSNMLWRYSLSDNALITLAPAPVVFETDGAKLARLSGDNIYAIRNGTYDYDNHEWLPTSDFWRYSISRNKWFSMDPLPKGVPADEGALLSAANRLYLIIGGPESAVYVLPVY